ncbi:MAG: hypothetical protein MJ170_04425 [Alphaproteobacteria bacterium]|nr:hypothetical protein [Alphaproteobacteria bacterium]
MFRYLFSVISFLFIIISPCVANIASSEYVNEMRNNVQAKIDKKADNANYTQNMVLQTDNSGNVVATTVGTDLFADGSIETMHLADGAVTNADLAGMIDITKLNLGTLPTSGKHIMIWNAETQKYVFERYATSILPDGYTQLNYIESDGGQWIDLGTLSSGSVEVVFSPTRLTGAATGTDYDGILGVNSAPQLGWYNAGWTIGNAGSVSPYKPEVGKVYTYKWTSNDGKSYIDNVPTGLSRSGTLTLKLFWCANASKPARCYSYKQYDSDGVLRVNLIPAKNSSGVIGMYDTLSDTFFTNKGSGNFIAGGTGILPAGYTQLEYIEATGTQYINLGTLSSGSVEVVFSPTRLTGASNTGYDGILGANSNPQLGWYSTGWTQGNTGSNYPYNPEIGKVYTYKWTANDGKLYIDNVSTGISRTGTLTLKLFQCEGTGKPSRCYEYRQYNSTGNLQVNLIPAKNSSGVIGMYDTVTKTFFTNSGTGNFIAGPEI